MYYATAKGMEKLDKLAVRSGLEIRQMMEFAGWHMVSLFRKLKISKGAKVVIFVGKGNKGGDGLSAARHLVNNGWRAVVVLLSKSMSEDAKHHLALIRKMRIPIILYFKDEVRALAAVKKSDILIDALIGYHLGSQSRGLFEEAIELMNKAKKKIIAYDLPSGIDATSGRCLAPCIRAYATLSLALPKRAFKTRGAQKTCGRIYVADIGIPKFLYDKIYRGSQPRFEDSPGFAVVQSGSKSSTSASLRSRSSFHIPRQFIR